MSVEGKASTVLNLRSGVPQGSVLAPTLFLIFINDLCDTLNNTPIVSNLGVAAECLVYADDTLILCSGSKERSVILSSNMLLEKAELWSRTWEMSFNPQKTDAMFFSKQHHDPKWQVLFAGKYLRYVDSHIRLGYTISSDLSTTKHVDSICRKVAQSIFLLRRLSMKTKDRNLLREVYVRYIRPIFEYASPSWAALPATQSERLEKLQRRAIRIIVGVPYTEPVPQQLYDDLSLDLLHARRSFAAACYG